MSQSSWTKWREREREKNKERERERERRSVAEGKLVARMVDNMSLASSTFDVVESTGRCRVSFLPPAITLQTISRVQADAFPFPTSLFAFSPLGASSVDKQKESFGKRRVKCPSAPQNADKRNKPKVCRGCTGYSGQGRVQVLLAKKTSYKCCCCCCWCVLFLKLPKSRNNSRSSSSFRILGLRSIGNGRQRCGRGSLGQRNVL